MVAARGRASNKSQSAAQVRKHGEGTDRGEPTREAALIGLPPRTAVLPLLSGGSRDPGSPVSRAAALDFAKNNVSRASPWPRQDVIRSIPCVRVTVSRQPQRHGLWVGQSGHVRTAKSKFAKRTWNVLCNQRNRKTGCGRRRLNPRAVGPSRGLSHLLPTGYIVGSGLRRVGLTCIILRARDLCFTLLQSGENSQKNQGAGGLGISDFSQMKAEKRSHSVSFRPLIASAAARQTAS